MTSAFETLADHLGSDRLNAYAVEHGLDRADPGWVGAMQMLPLLDAIALTRNRVEAGVENLPEAMLTLAPEILEAIAGAVQGGVVLAVAEYSADAIRDAITDGIGAHLEPVRKFVASVHEVLLADYNALEDCAALDSVARALPRTIAQLIDQHDVLLMALTKARNILASARDRAAVDACEPAIAKRHSADAYATAIEHYLYAIHRADPGWVRAVQMLPLLDAMAAERERIEGTVAYLPEAMLALAPEIAQAIADAVQGGVVAVVAEYAADAIRSAIADGIDAHLEPVRYFVASVYEVLLADSAALDYATAFGLAHFFKEHDVRLMALTKARKMLVSARDRAAFEAAERAIAEWRVE